MYSTASVKCAHVACGRLCAELLSAKTVKCKDSQRIRTARTAFALAWENSTSCAHLVQMN